MSDFQPTSGRSYRIVSFLLGLALIAAGVMKLIDVYGEPDPAGTASGILGRLTAGAEIAFAAWLVIGLAPWRSRLVAVAVFLGLANVALASALAGRSSCDCFGRADIGPWVAFGFDAFAVVALLAARPAPPADRPPLWRRVAAGGWATGVIALAAALLANNPTPWVAKGLDSPVPQADKDLLARVIEGIEANDATFRSLSLSVEKVIRTPGVAKEERGVQKLPGGGLSIVVRRPLRTLKSQVVVSADGVRSSLYENDKLLATEAVTRERYYEDQVKANRAWVRDPEVKPRLLESKASLSTWGLGVPVSHPRDWFAAVHVVSVAERATAAGPGVEIRAEYRPPHIKRVDVLIVRFAAAYNYLPVEAEQRMEDSRLTHTAELTYQSITPGSPGWVPATIQTRCWTSGDAKERDPSLLLQAIDIRVRPPTEVDREVPPGTFSPGVAAGTTLSDSRPGDRETRTLKTASTSVEEALARFGPPQPTPEERRADAWRRLPVWPFVVFNGLAVAVCVWLRKRLVF
jgi:hypothetical protein